jgi:hypothetical protein
MVEDTVGACQNEGEQRCKCGRIAAIPIFCGDLSSKSLGLRCYKGRCHASRDVVRSTLAYTGWAVGFGALARTGASPRSYQRLGTPRLNQIAILIEDSSVPCDYSPTPFCLRLQRLDGGKCVDRVAEKYRLMKLPFEDRQKREGVDARRLAHQSTCDGKAEQAMRDRPSEWAAPRRRMIDMKGIEISRQTSKEYNIGLRDGPSWAFPLVTNHKIIECPDRPRVASHDGEDPP